MTTDFTIAIIGGGPAGISAAVHAARRGVSHTLIESRSQLFGTVYEFPKSKQVMAAPNGAPLLSDLPFEPGSRENVIAGWADVVERSGVNVRLNAEVTAITGRQGKFKISLADGSKITAEYIVMAVGLSNSRKLKIPGAEGNTRVHYRTDNPEEIEGEDIVVIGKGDSAIEDALGLAKRNQVTMVYRGGTDFGHAHPANSRRLQEAIRRGVIQAYAHSEPQRIEGEHLLIGQAA